MCIVGSYVLVLPVVVVVVNRQGYATNQFLKYWTSRIKEKETKTVITIIINENL